MKTGVFVLHLFLQLLVVLGHPINTSKDATIIEQINEGDYPNNYHFKYVTSDGITREEVGNMLPNENGKESLVVHGYYSFVGTDNRLHFHKYTADDKGYRELPFEEIDLSSSNASSQIKTAVIQRLQGGGIG